MESTESCSFILEIYASSEFATFSKQKKLSVKKVILFSPISISEQKNTVIQLPMSSFSLSLNVDELNFLHKY